MKKELHFNKFCHWKEQVTPDTSGLTTLPCWSTLLVMQHAEGIYGKLKKEKQQRMTMATNYAGKKTEKERKGTLPATEAALQFGRLFLLVWWGKVLLGKWLKMFLKGFIFCFLRYALNTHWEGHELLSAHTIAWWNASKCCMQRRGYFSWHILWLVCASGKERGERKKNLPFRLRDDNFFFSVLYFPRFERRWLQWATRLSRNTL